METIQKKHFENNQLSIVTRWPLIFVLCFLILIGGNTSCKKIVEVDAPYTSTNAENVFKDDATAISALTGLYTRMSNLPSMTGSGSINLYAGLSSDELTLFSSDVRYKAYYTNALASLDASVNYGAEAWGPLYQLIYYCNEAIERLAISTTLTPSVHRQLLGEAKFIRAFNYFYLVNLFGDVPLAITTDYKANALLTRTPVDQVYQQVISDLKDAKELLSENYLGPNLLTASTERVRPTKWAAKALLARSYLYTKKYAMAEDESSSVIANATQFGLAPVLTDVFLKNSIEAIWQLQPVVSGRNTEDARTFIITSTGPTTTTDRPVYIASQWRNNFEANDLRKSKWIDSVTTTGGIKYFFPGKYKNNSAVVTEYLMIFRLAEQYLIRAEARAQQNNLAGAIGDLDKIRLRSNISLIAITNPGISQAALLDKILHERQVELFTEWAHRWLDLKRTGKVDEVMSIATPIKSAGMIQWQPFQKLYPLPYSELQKAPNLIQNVGY